MEFFDLVKQKVILQKLYSDFCKYFNKILENILINFWFSYVNRGLKKNVYSKIGISLWVAFPVFLWWCLISCACRTLILMLIFLVLMFLRFRNFLFLVLCNLFITKIKRLLFFSNFRVLFLQKLWFILSLIRRSVLSLTVTWSAMSHWSLT